MRTKELVIYVDIDGVALCDPKGAATTGGSDDVEWESLLRRGTVRVVPPEEAEKIRRDLKHRVCGSRMVRRYKCAADGST